MFKKSFKSKIILPSAIILVVLTIAMTTYVSLEFASYSENLVNEKVLANIKLLKIHINNSKAYSRTAAITMAYNPEVVEAVKNRDRSEILRIFNSAYDLYNHVNFYTITDNKGVVLARTHEPENFGDLVSNQQNIKNAMEGTVSTYFEAGTAARVSARTGAPIYDSDGTLIGIVSAGVRFDTEEMVDKLKEQLHSDISVFLGDTRITTTILNNGKRIQNTKINPQIAEVVLDGKSEYFGEINIFGIRYKTFYMPLLNAKDEAFATFFIGTPMAELKMEANDLIKNVIIINCIALIISIAFLYVVVSSISKPLVLLSKEIDNIEDGNLCINIDIKNHDEVGRAGKALQKMVNTIHKLIENIKETINEHKKGNMDYHLSTEVFHGDYRLLADNIVELSNLGLKDQLTGLPNRHALNGRLDLEWSRALREKVPISFLIIDVDKFKLYNDTYGHQQGDAVLQAIAGAMTRPLKRGVDFVARWGGEEFVALLPNTDLNGAFHVAEKIRVEIENAKILGIDSGTANKVTVSIGINTQVPTQESTISNLISKADEALYIAKESGRNRTCRYGVDT